MKRKKNMKRNRRRLIPVGALATAGLLLIGLTLWHGGAQAASAADFGDLACDVKSADDKPEAEFSLYNALKSFNQSEEAWRRCRLGITIHVPIVLLHPIKITGRTVYGANADLKKRLVIDGLGNTLFADQLPKNECAVTITSDYVTLKNITILGAKGNGICVKGDPLSIGVQFENVTVAQTGGIGIHIGGEAREIRIQKGTQILDTAGAGIKIEGAMLGKAFELFHQFDVEGKPAADSVALFRNGPGYSAAIDTPSKLKFTNVKVLGKSVQGFVKNCPAGGCELTTVSEVLIYRLGQEIINNTDQCTNALEDVSAALTLNKIDQEKALSTCTSGTPAVETKKFLECKGRVLPAFRICMVETTAPDGATAEEKENLKKARQIVKTLPWTNLLGVAKVDQTSHFILNTQQDLANSDDPIFLVPVDAKGDTGTIIGSSSCPFVPKLAVKPQDVASEGCAGVSTDGSGGSGTDGNGGGGVSNSGSGGGTGDQIRVQYYNVSTGAWHDYTLGEDEVIARGFANYEECKAGFEKFYGTNVGSSQSYPDSDRDNIPDIYEDRNHDCTQNDNETNWLSPDSDGDGIRDDHEMRNKFGALSCFVIAKGVDAAGKETALSTGNFPAYDENKYNVSKVFAQKNPKDGKTYMVLPYVVEQDTLTGAPCSKQAGIFSAAFGECASGADDALKNGVYPRDFEDGTEVGKGFCTGTNPLKFDTDQDGLFDGEELKPAWYNQYDAYKLWEYWGEGKPVNEKDESGSFTPRTCPKEAEVHKIGTYYMKQPIEIEVTRFDDPTQREKVVVDKWYACISDAVLKKGAVATGGYYNLVPGQDGLPFDTGIGQTNPFNIDTDKDGFCDSQLGAGSACVAAGMTEDQTPWFFDKTNTLQMPCKAGVIYNFVKPDLRDGLKEAVLAFQAWSPAQALGLSSYQEIEANVASFYMTQVANLVAKNGGAPLHDLDKDGIPDVVESPNGECKADIATDAFATDAFKKDTDVDGLDDRHDPCPNKAYPYTTIEVNGTKQVDFANREAYEAELVKSASECGASGPNIYAANKALVCHLDWDNDDLVNCREDADMNGGSPATNLFETNVLLSDSDQDGLRDYIEVESVKTNPTVIDTDKDKLSDRDEVILDGDETTYNPPLAGKSAGTCADAKAHDTNPLVYDTDGDGLFDGFELSVDNGRTPTNPNNPDSDSDGICDGIGEATLDGAILTCTGDTFFEDKNGDGAYPRKGKLLLGNIGESDPCDPDTDGDGKSDKEDLCKNIGDQSCTTPNVMGNDSDSDGIPDLTEDTVTKTSAKLKDTDGDGLVDGCLKDKEGKPIMDSGELCNQVAQSQFFENFGQLNAPSCGGVPYTGCDTDPLDADTDDDLLTDKQERTYPANPLVNDTDGDCITDGIEDAHFTPEGTPIANSINGFFAGCVQQQGGLVCTETNANDWDTDKDGLSDGKVGIMGEDLNCNGFRDIGLVPETDPRVWDTDGDNESDFVEMTWNGAFSISNAGPATAGRTGCSLVAGSPARSGDKLLWTLLVVLPLAGLFRLRVREE